MSISLFCTYTLQLYVLTNYKRLSTSIVLYIDLTAITSCMTSLACIQMLL